jgi:hypothetical protein
MAIVLENAAPADPVAEAARALAEAAAASGAPYTLGALMGLVARASAPLALREAAGDMGMDDHLGIAAFHQGEAQKCCDEWGACALKASDMARSAGAPGPVREYHSQASQLAEQAAGHMMACCHHLGEACGMMGGGGQG